MLLPTTVVPLLYLHMNKHVDSCAIMLDQRFGHFEVAVNAKCIESQQSTSFRKVHRVILAYEMYGSPSTVAILSDDFTTSYPPCGTL